MAFACRMWHLPVDWGFSRPIRPFPSVLPPYRLPRPWAGVRRALVASCGSWAPSGARMSSLEGRRGPPAPRCQMVDCRCRGRCSGVHGAAAVIAVDALLPPWPPYYRHDLRGRRRVQGASRSPYSGGRRRLYLWGRRSTSRCVCKPHESQGGPLPER